ncbi:MAG: M23 family metallopeptidase [Leptospiraceae bacterium]|nr:M23 family metallopeptidase [Leptospiraceae bacterium]
MKKKLNFFIILITLFFLHCQSNNNENKYKNVALALLLLQSSTNASGGSYAFTPEYYTSSGSGSIKESIDSITTISSKVSFQNPFQDSAGNTVSYQIASGGNFGDGKGPGGTGEHHTGTDYHLVGSNLISVNLYAAHDGTIYTTTTSSKYRHYLSIEKDITDSSGTVLGKMVTLYAHIDLDLDVSGGLSMNGKTVAKGDLVSRNLYSGTAGGPHLHFEIRYYRSNDTTTQDFYGGIGTDSSLTEKSSGVWSYGYWNPSVGYGFENSTNRF